MSAFLKGMRWAVLLICYRAVVRVCGLFRIALPMTRFGVHTISGDSDPIMLPHALRSNSESYHSLDE
jgi:hypothetical protein